jgi:hypothetical protein
LTVLEFEIGRFGRGRSIFLFWGAADMAAWDYPSPCGCLPVDRVTLVHGEASPWISR